MYDDLYMQKINHEPQPEDLVWNFDEMAILYDNTPDTTLHSGNGRVRIPREDTKKCCTVLLGISLSLKKAMPFVIFKKMSNRRLRETLAANVPGVTFKDNKSVPTISSLLCTICVKHPFTSFLFYTCQYSVSCS